MRLRDAMGWRDPSAHDQHRLRTFREIAQKHEKSARASLLARLQARSPDGQAVLCRGEGRGWLCTLNATKSSQPAGNLG